MPGTRTIRLQPISVIYGDEDFRKRIELEAILDSLLPPDVDRTTALSVYDGAAGTEQGGPTLALVMDDLGTLPFLADRRVVVVREADDFISKHREALERYVGRPFPTGALILECGSFPKTTRLYKAVEAAGGRIVECRRPSQRELGAFVDEQAKRLGKRMESAAAARLVDFVGPDLGMLANEVEKLCLYAADVRTISDEHVRELVGQSREEKIFAVMDAAAAGDRSLAVRLWNDTLQSDPAAAYKAVGGMSFVVRRWIAAQAMSADGMSASQIAPKVMMYGRVAELEKLLRRLPGTKMAQLLGRIAELDSQAKSGTRSIERGVESLLIEIASARS